MSVYYSANLAPVTRMAEDVRAAMRGSVLDALEDAHGRMAARVRQNTVDELHRRKKETGRPQERGEHLERAINSPYNSEVHGSGFSVGIEDWLRDSPAGPYYRRIELGGDNPMHALGYIAGRFYDAAGFYNQPASGAKHGRLKWSRVRHGGWIVGAFDAASAGYHMHEVGGERFYNSGLPKVIYKRAFERHGLNFIEMYEGLYGAVPTSRGMVI